MSFPPSGYGPQNPQQPQSQFQPQQPQFPPRPQFHPQGHACCDHPRPPRFWQIFLKDVFTTVLGVSLFCFLCFVFVLAVGAIAVKSLGEIASGGVDMSNSAIVENEISGDESAPNKIVVVPITGVIETEDDGFLVQTVEALREEENLRAVVLRVDSPGGTVSGSDLYHHLFSELKKDLNIPVVVSMGDVAASGGYYISSLGDKIFAERSTMTGSIGVIMSMYNAAELCKKLGVKSDPVTSGPMKGMGDIMKERSEEETEIWQSMVNSSYEQFLGVIKEGRAYYGAPGDDASLEERDKELREVADGRIYSADQALEKHLIDEIGFLPDAIKAAMELADITEDNTYVVRYEEEEGFLSSLGIGMKATDKKTAKALERISTPKCWYLVGRSLPL